MIPSNSLNRVQPYSDPEVIQEILLGNTALFEILIRRYNSVLYKTGRGYGFNHHDTEDLMQETFINAARHIGQLRCEEKFAAWLFGIARQKCWQAWRRKDLLQEASALSEELVGGEESPADFLIAQEDERAFRTALAAVPPLQREALVLHFLEEFSLEEIAEITGARLGTVKSRIHYGKQMLKQRMQS